MVLPISGNSINLMNVQLEYGGSEPISLNEYYGFGRAPSSGAISLGDFLQIGTQTSAISSGLLFELDARNSNSYNGSSIWYDTTGNNRNFTLINGPTSSTSSVDFDGTNDYAEISHDSWIPQGTSSWTLEAYVSIDDFAFGSFNSNVRYLFSKSQPSNQAFSVGFKTISSTQLYMVAASEGGGNVSADTHRYDMGNPSSWTGAYHHFVWTYNGSNLTFYIDGSQVYTVSGLSFSTNTAVLRLFAFDPTNGNWGCWVNGKGRVMRMYNTALSSAQVSTNYSNCTGPISPVSSKVSVSPAFHSGSLFTATFTFLENVADFVTGDITVTNGSKGTFTAVSAKVYTLDITPTTTSSTVSISIPSSATFNAGNFGNDILSASVSYSTFDTTNLAINLDANSASSYSGSGSTWYDISGNGNNGTLINGPVYTSSSSGNYFQFDGSDDYVTVPDSNSLDISGNFSASAWFMFYGLPSGECAFLRKNDVFQLGMSNSNTIRCLLSTNGTSGWTAANDHSYSFTLNKWYYMTMTYDGSNMKIYVDTTLVKTATVTGTISVNAESLTIGKWDSVLNGRLGTVHMYSKALSSSEISNNYSYFAAKYIKPVVTITPGSHQGSQFTATFSWSETLSDFTSSDITVTNGSKGTFSGSGTTYTLVITPSSNATVTVSVASGSVTGAYASNDTTSTQIVYSSFPSSGLVHRLNNTSSSYSGSGTTWYDIAGTNNITLRNSPTWNSANGYFTFNGSTQDGLFSSSINTNSNFTFAMWIRPNGTGARTLFSGTVTGHLQLRINNNNLNLLKSFTTDLGNFGTNTFTNGTLYLVVVTRSSNTYTAYVNNSQWGSITTSAQTFITSNPTIASSRSGGEKFNGDIYGFAWYNTVLSSSDISSLYSAGSDLN